jgi:hypothetical protein
MMDRSEETDKLLESLSSPCGPKVTAMLLAHADRPSHDMTKYAEDYWDELNEEKRERYRHLERVARAAIFGRRLIFSNQTD